MLSALVHGIKKGLTSSSMSQPYSCDVVMGMVYFFLGGTLDRSRVSTRLVFVCWENSDGTVLFGLSARERGFPCGLIV